MAKVSKNSMGQVMEAATRKVLLDTFREARTDEEVALLLNDLLTPSEKIMLSKRLAIAYFLTEGKTYLEISKKLKVSFATINLVKSAKLRGGSGFQIFIKALGKRIG